MSKRLRIDELLCLFEEDRSVHTVKTPIAKSEIYLPSYTVRTHPRHD